MTMTFRGIVSFTALFLLFCLPANAQNYTFSPIADTGGPFSSFSAPALNDGGVVAVFADLDEGGSGIFTGSSGSLTPIANTTGPFSSFISRIPSINDAGTVAFSANLTAGGSGIFTGDGGSTTTIADTNGPFSSFSSVSPSINDAGTVAFGADLRAGGSGVFTGSGGPPTPIATISGMFTSFRASPSINAGGTVAFVGGVSRFNQTLFIGDGGSLIPVTTAAGPSSGFDPPSINAGGTVAFATLFPGPGGRGGIFTATAGQITTIADLTGPFLGFFAPPSINDAGAVAFGAYLRAGGAGPFTGGLFTGPDPVADRVIVAGDPLFGSTVRSLDFFREGLNNAGQLAFRATLDDGRQVIARADPADVIPEPGSLALLLGVGAPGLGLALRRRRV